MLMIDGSIDWRTSSEILTLLFPYQDRGSLINEGRNTLQVINTGINPGTFQLNMASILSFLVMPYGEAFIGYLI